MSDFVADDANFVLLDIDVTLERFDYELAQGRNVADEAILNLAAAKMFDTV